MHYHHLHTNLARQRGKASSYSCACGAPATQWAYDHSDPDEITDERGRVYSTDVSRYVPLCIPCHRKLDARPTCPAGHFMSGPNLYIDPRGARQCRRCRADKVAAIKRRKRGELAGARS